ncbi:hypothetical protein FRC02_004341 [Tulasnella sp. 418]|nr:hypothetical protein FRC02_004341 [Tulasnella sp. 418]
MLKHGARNNQSFQWAVLPLKAEIRKAEFVDFTETARYKDLHKQGEFSPNEDFRDYLTCRDFMRIAGDSVEATNQLMTRTGTSIPPRVYYNAILFSPDMKFVRIRDEYRTDGSPSRQRWTKDDIRIRSEYPVHNHAQVRGVCGDDKWGIGW